MKIEITEACIVISINLDFDIKLIFPYLLYSACLLIYSMQMRNEYFDCN